jgi:hypothetical protein
MYHNGINFNLFGVFSRGGSATSAMGWNDITNNDSFGIHSVDSGILKTYTPATNVIDGNGADDPTNASAPLKKQALKRARHWRKHHKGLIRRHRVR